MATLRLSIGPVTAEVTTSDAHAADLVADYIAAYGGPAGGTNQQRLTWCVRHLAGHLKAAGDGLRVREAAEAARLAELAQREAKQWD